MNIIELVLDCASYNRIEDKPDHPSPMPYLMSLKEKGIWCTRCYSQGPYTESALMGLTFGKDTLDDNGYFASFFDWDKSIYRQFKNVGYDVFVTFSYSVMPKEIRTECEYTDSSNYCAPFFSRFIRSRLDYYHAIFQRNELLNDDKIIIADFLENVFDVMLSYYTADTLKNDHTKCAFETRSKEQIKKIESWRILVKDEANKFKESPMIYIDSLFSNYQNHFVVQDCDLFPSEMKESVKQNRKWIKSKKKLFNRLYWIKMKEYLFTNHPDKGQVLHHLGLLFKKKERHIGGEYFKRYVKAAFFYNKKKMIDNSVKQLLPCARNDIDSLIDWIKDRESRMPFFAYVHVDDYHGESVLCSYDLEERQVIENELDEANTYIDGLEHRTKGDVVKDLSLKYLDGCIEHLFEKLQNLNILDDTIVVITADHGSSNAGGPFRYTNTNNFYDEQYHPILYIFGLEKNRVIEQFINGKDIARTLLEVADIPFKESFNGVNFLNTCYRNHTYVEYMGTGMPDMIRRPVFFEYRDERISYVLSINICVGIESLKLHEYYDLESDPLEYKNLAEKHYKEKEDLFMIFETRLSELKDNYSCYLGSLRKKYLQREVGTV